MKTFEQFEHEQAMNDMRYPKPKCKIAYCGKDTEALNDGFCFKHTPQEKEEKNLGHDLNSLGSHQATCRKCFPHDSSEKKCNAEQSGVKCRPPCKWCYGGEIVTPSADFSDWEERLEKVLSTGDGREIKSFLRNLIQKEREEAYTEGFKEQIRSLFGSRIQDIHEALFYAENVRKSTRTETIKECIEILDKERDIKCPTIYSSGFCCDFHYTIEFIKTKLKENK